MENKKTFKITLKSIKDSDGWVELAYYLKFDEFQKNNPSLNEDELHNKFYNEVIYKNFKYGEYANLEIEVDENFNIIGGKIF
ncbi:MAG: hypothetical protein ACOC2W_02705 [bacterium]